MPRYAANTNVSTAQSQEQIRNTLRRYGADGFGVIERRDHAAVMFEINNFTMQMTVPLPPIEEFQTSDGRCVKDHLLPQLTEQAASGKLPRHLALPEPK